MLMSGTHSNLNCFQYPSMVVVCLKDINSIWGISNKDDWSPCCTAFLKFFQSMKDKHISFYCNHPSVAPSKHKRIEPNCSASFKQLTWKYYSTLANQPNGSSPKNIGSSRQDGSQSHYWIPYNDRKGDVSWFVGFSFYFVWNALQNFLNKSIQGVKVEVSSLNLPI